LFAFLDKHVVFSRELSKYYRSIL